MTNLDIINIHVKNINDCMEDLKAYLENIELQVEQMQAEIYDLNDDNEYLRNKLKKQTIKELKNE